ncbi:MAG TPA: hypothetical protein VGE93_07830, partial [Bryobacteraceae bacterium]
DLSQSGRSKEGRNILLCPTIHVSREMPQHHRYNDRLRQQIPRAMHLHQHLIPLPTLTWRLLLALIVGQLLVEETGALTATDRVEPVDTKILGDKIPVDLEFGDQAPLAEALGSYQENK